MVVNSLRMITVKVCYALPNQQTIINITIPKNSTVVLAIIKSGILDQFPEINLQKNEVGIFSKKVTLNHVLEGNERIEIYRPLLLTPNQQRLLRQRAAAKIRNQKK